jgi:hypothetical protein
MLDNFVLGLLTAIVPALLQLLVLLRWLHRHMRDAEISRAFVRDVALNHLPHIYTALRQIAAHQGIELEEPPLVQFLDLNGVAPTGRGRARS